MNELSKRAWLAFVSIFTLLAAQQDDVQQVEGLDLEVAYMIWGNRVDALIRAGLVEPAREGESLRVSREGLREFKRWCARDATRTRTYADVIHRLDAVLGEPVDTKGANAPAE